MPGSIRSLSNANGDACPSCPGRQHEIGTCALVLSEASVVVGSEGRSGAVVPALGVFLSDVLTHESVGVTVVEEGQGGKHPAVPRVIGEEAELGEYAVDMGFYGLWREEETFGDSLV